MDLQYALQRHQLTSYYLKKLWSNNTPVHHELVGICSLSMLLSLSLLLLLYYCYFQCDYCCCCNCYCYCYCAYYYYYDYGYDYDYDYDDDEYFYYCYSTQLLYTPFICFLLLSQRWAVTVQSTGLQAAWHTSGMVPSSCWACLLVGAQVPIGRLPTGWLRRGREARLALKWRSRHAMTLPNVATCNKVHTSCPASATWVSICRVSICSASAESASGAACQAAATCCCL